MFLITYLILKLTNIELAVNSITDVKTKDTPGHNFQGYPIDNDVLQKLQHNDIFCKNYPRSD